MSLKENRVERLLAALLRSPYAKKAAPVDAGEFGLPRLSTATTIPEKVDLTTVVHPDGRMSQYPPAEKWDDWMEWDGKAWPRKVARRYMLVPTVCFNCESACGLLAYVDRETLDVQEVRGQSGTPGKSRSQLRQGSGDHQPGLRSRAHPVSAEAGRQAGRGAVEAGHLGRGAQRDIARRCVRAAWPGAMESCTTSVVRERTATRIAASRHGASTGTTATPTSARPAHAPATRSGPAAIGPARIMPTHASSC